MWPAFQQWPEESQKQFAEMLRRIFREELAATINQGTRDDADYLASLTPEQRKQKSRERMKR